MPRDDPSADGAGKAKEDEVEVDEDALLLSLINVCASCIVSKLLKTAPLYPDV